MFIYVEVIVISTAAINFIAAITVFLGLLISGRRTPTHIYLIYTSVLWLLKQLVNPVLHEWLVRDLIKDYDFKELLPLIYISLVIGVLGVMYLFLLMDYFKCISNFKYCFILANAVLIISVTLFHHFILGASITSSFMVLVSTLVFSLVFLLLVLTHDRMECLKKRKETDSESELRKSLVFTYLCVRIVTGIILLAEWFVSMITWRYFTGVFAIGFYHLDTVFYLISLIKNDILFRNRLLDFFRMCTFRIRRKIQFENLSSDNGRLINQDPVAPIVV